MCVGLWGSLNSFTILLILLQFDDASYDVVFDKGALDAFMGEASAACLKAVRSPRILRSLYAFSGLLGTSSDSHVEVARRRPELQTRVSRTSSIQAFYCVRPTVQACRIQSPRPSVCSENIMMPRRDGFCSARLR